jgi:LAO/AO transport system kinase
MSEGRRRPSAAELADGVLEGRRRSLSRALSSVEADDERASELLTRLYPRSGRAATVGVTGPPGAGKSTLVGALIAVRRTEQRRVALLAVDPSSPFTGGAVLGDRLRLSDHYEDPAVFIRSLASRGALGGLSGSTMRALVVLDAFGFEEVVVETVGVGQSEVDVARHTDTVVLVLIPGSGDSIQALKAGVMEVPDVVCVNKREHPDADSMVRDLRTALAHSGRAGWRIPVIATEARTGAGVEELVAAVDAHGLHLRTGDGLTARRRAAADALVGGIVLGRLVREVDRALREGSLDEALADVARRRIDPGHVADRLLAEIWSTREPAAPADVVDVLAVSDGT